MHRVTLNIHTDSERFKEELSYLKLNPKFNKAVKTIRAHHGITKTSNTVQGAVFQQQIDTLIKEFRLENIHRGSLEDWVRTLRVTPFMSMRPFIVEFESTLEREMHPRKNEPRAQEALVRITSDTTKEDLLTLLPRLRRSLRWKGPRKNPRTKNNSVRDLEIYRLHALGHTFKEVARLINETGKYERIDEWAARTINDRVKKRARIK